MPNWCEDELIVRGDKETLKKFREFAKGKHKAKLDFCAFIPYPKEYEELDEACYETEKQIQEMTKKIQEAKTEEEKKRFEGLAKLIFQLRPKRDGYNSGGYEWCCANWGTKWNAKEVQVKERERSLFYSFQTAWSPPSPVVFAMSRAFPTLEFCLKFWERGVGYQGTYKIKAGKVLKDVSKEYRGSRGG